MAPKSSKNTARKPNGTMEKLAPIPKGAKIQKRPLTRRQPPASSKERIIYISSSTPFMSAVKRVRKQLDEQARRRATGPAQKNASLHARVEALKRVTTAATAAAAAAARNGKDSGDDDDAAANANGGAVVKVMGTGKAVEKTLKVASFFEQQADVSVEIRTGTVGAVDDIVVPAEGEEGGGGEDESRVRRVSSLEVSVRLR